MANLDLNLLKAGAYLGCLGQHDAGRAIFPMAHGHSALNGRSRNALAFDSEVHVNFGEHLGVGVCPFRSELDGTALNIMPTPLQNQNNNVGGSPPSSC